MVTPLLACEHAEVVPRTAGWRDRVRDRRRAARAGDRVAGTHQEETDPWVCGIGWSGCARPRRPAGEGPVTFFGALGSCCIGDAGLSFQPNCRPRPAPHPRLRTCRSAAHIRCAHRTGMCAVDPQSPGHCPTGGPQQRSRLSSAARGLDEGDRGTPRARWRPILKADAAPRSPEVIGVTRRRFDGRRTPCVVFMLSPGTEERTLQRFFSADGGWSRQVATPRMRIVGVSTPRSPMVGRTEGPENRRAARIRSGREVRLD
jgi:hypothetical protein